MNIHSDAHSLFTRFKDRFFSNYQYLDELKNVELHADVFSGFSLSLGAPVELFGFNAGGGFVLDYYLKEGMALRTGFGIKGYRLYRKLQLKILNDIGDVVSSGSRIYRNRMTQLTIPIQLLITRFKYNRGLWVSFGATMVLNVAGHYQLENKSDAPIPGDLTFPNSPSVPAFSNNSSINGRPDMIYFNRAAVYADMVVGYKLSRFVNLYADLQISATALHSIIAHNINNHSLNFGALLSLWQY